MYMKNMLKRTLRKEDIKNRNLKKKKKGICQYIFRALGTGPLTGSFQSPLQVSLESGGETVRLA